MVQIKKSKPISQIKKGDKVRIDKMQLEVDTQYLMKDHGEGAKEMIIELFDPKAGEGKGDYQLRYFSDNVDGTLQFFELKEIIYKEVVVEKVEW